MLYTISNDVLLIFGSLIFLLNKFLLNKLLFKKLILLLILCFLQLSCIIFAFFLVYNVKNKILLK